MNIQKGGTNVKKVIPMSKRGYQCEKGDTNIKNAKIL